MVIQGWPPSHPQIPDLSGLTPKIASNYALRRAIPGGIPLREIEDDLLMNFPRLLDKTLSSYEAARKDLEIFLRGASLEESLGFLMSATSNLETCIGSYCRTIKVARGLQKLGCIPVSSQIPPEQPFRFIRNAIEHIDEKIEGGYIDSLESPVCLLLANEFIRITKVELTYAELAASIKKLFDLTAVIRATS